MKEKLFHNVIVDSQSFLAKAVLTSGTNTTEIDSQCPDIWVTAQGISTRTLTNISAQSVSKFFQTLCTYIRAEHLAIGHHLQRYGKKESSYTMIIAGPQPDVAEQRQA